MKDLINYALNILSRKNIDYADIRIGRDINESIVLKNKVVEGVEKGESIGFGIRVLKNGAWGFASSHNLSKQGVERIAKQAIEVAGASAVVRGERVVLAKADKITRSYKTPIQKDPLKVSISDKLQLMSDIENIMRKEIGRAHV